MSTSLSNILRYWRASLADGALGEGTFRTGDRKRFIELPNDALKTGCLPKHLVQTLFRGKDEASTVSVRFWPLVTARRTSHAVSRADGMPELVAPVVTEGFVDRAGRIIPTRNAIARDLLTPLPRGAFALGSVEALDAFLTTTPLPETLTADGWQDYRQHCRQMVDALSPGWPSDETEYLPTGNGFIEVSEGADATVRGMLDLYDSLLADKPDTPLLHQIALPCLSDGTPDCLVEQEFARRLGHSNPHFPLAEHQRQVLAWLDATKPGEVIAVNGPPGTGKTTMLLSAVAGLWVKAALDGGDPPVIVAASSNNQAVTNIIDAFGKDFAAGEGAFAARWLPDIKSFGMFLPSHSRRTEAALRYQTEAFQAECESVAYFERAKAAWLEAAEKAFPGSEGTDVAGFVAKLRNRLTEEVTKLRDLDTALDRRRSCAAALSAELGDDPDAEQARRVDALRLSQDELDQLAAARAALDHYLASESLFTGLFGFLPSVKRQRALKARLAIGDLLDGLRDLSRVEDIEARVSEEARRGQKGFAAAKELLARAESLKEQAKASELAWRKTAESFADSVDLGELERRADIGIRFDLFLLATHYWEGRWLMAMEADLSNITASHEKTGRKAIEPRWKRRMMLTPCAVATFASLPGKLSCSRYQGGKFARDSLYNFIDLLIVDEAGQVLPEVAGASFALAKRALVIGDTQQIEPISAVPKPVDIGNLNDCALIDGKKVPDHVNVSGILSTGGSAMRLAQQACKISPWPELDRGLYLFEHRRCHDEIIGFSNALCYKGKLRPMRGLSPADAPLPALGYLHIEGRAFTSGGSRANPVEARTIAAWLEDSRALLEGRYGCPLEQIVGVVTPFGQQVRAIRDACTARGITVSGRDGMTIGTIHALQGAERPVVIFSPVYSKHADGGFIDASPSMLNVTVSRAKDSCLIFGDMDVLATARSSSPRALLSEFLDAKGKALDFAMEPREDLTQGEARVEMLQQAAEHDAFLLEALRGNGRRYMIVSPWVVAGTIERTGLLDAMATASQRGAEIEVFADPLLNKNPSADGESQMEAVERRLSEIGVAMHRVPKLHSKIVTVDKELLCAGSFNWLSADRNGQYARHETSFVYRGAHLEDEIKIIREGLMQRAK
ncbi:AAA domain-containing protein [uncultured Cohaesibacter sp.]|uniref:AAA domain-containing protein n=1 Tax=uncultured Cohaesibacter sp. TaxID=1002546 RepID=UPI002AA7A207|nr:AAA domain-containing protein [uncultured Cohaesibacter sp.]